MQTIQVMEQVVDHHHPIRVCGEEAHHGPVPVLQGIGTGEVATAIVMGVDAGVRETLAVAGDQVEEGGVGVAEEVGAEAEDQEEVVAVVAAKTTTG